jgi:hemerythrin-like domain-containing protein
MTAEGISGKGIGMLLAIHAAIQRDLGRLVGSAGVLTDPGIRDHDRAVGAAGLASYWACLAEQLHHHHTIEDEEVFPYVRGALGDRADSVMDAMSDEHERITGAQDGVDTAVAALREQPTADNAVTVSARLLTFQEVVQGHLAHEEAEAIPLILEGFDEGYWLAFMGRRQQDPGADTFLPWVLEGAPDPAVAEVTGALPPPVRELLVSQWQPAHTARVDALPARS